MALLGEHGLATCHLKPACWNCQQPMVELTEDRDLGHSLSEVPLPSVRLRALAPKPGSVAFQLASQLENI